jgi:hypothetical protein
VTDRIDPAPEDPLLRELFQALPRRRAPGEECPEPAELWAAARGEVGAERQRWLIGHTGRCPSCAEDWRLARHLERSGAETTERAFDRPWRGAFRHAGDGEGHRPRLQRLALAATVILAVAVAALWTTQAGLERRQTVDRSDDRSTIESLTPSDQPLPRDRPVLRWAAPEEVEGARYEVTVTTEQLDVVARADRLGTPEYRLPAEAIADLPSGAILLWRVEVRSRDGRTVTSPTYRIRLE